MASGSAVRRPGPAERQAIRRRRSLAALVVLLCVAADVWVVSSAGAKEPLRDGALSRASRVAVAAGSGPAVSLDEVERVPDAATDSQVGSRTGSNAGAGSTGAAGGAAGSTSGAAPTRVVGDGRDDTGAVIESGTGRFTAVAVPAAALRPAPATGRVVRYTVEVEGGLDVRPQQFAATVGAVLSDPRGWQTADGVRFVAVAPKDATKTHVDLRVTLASPDTTDRLCAPLETRGEVSCHNTGRVVLNLRRWVLGAQAYGADVAGYRTYLVNHEVGHGIGHAHAYCGGPGTVAPVMMQQTYGLKGCTAWPWPTPKQG